LAIYLEVPISADCLDLPARILVVDCKATSISDEYVLLLLLLLVPCLAVLAGSGSYRHMFMTNGSS